MRSSDEGCSSKTSVPSGWSSRTSYSTVSKLSVLSALVQISESLRWRSGGQLSTIKT